MAAGDAGVPAILLHKAAANSAFHDEYAVFPMSSRGAIISARLCERRFASE